MNRNRKAWLFSLLGASLFVLALVRSDVATTAESAYEKIRILIDILDHVQTNYVESVELKDLVYGAAHGIVRTLDPFSQFLPPEALNDMKIETEGEFGGIGIRVHVADSGWLTVITPLPGTPAFRAGIFPQDKIVKINGISTEGITIEKAVNLLRGKPNTKVVITVARESKNPEGEPAETVKDIELTREVIKIQTIFSNKIEGTDIGYVRIAEFNAQTPGDVQAALSKLAKEGMKALVLDLRFNPGGLLPSAIDTVKNFVGDEKVIVYTQGRRPESRVEYHAAARAPFFDLPLAVLVNQGSASGSEIVAGALKDHKRATVIGSRSFGKGSVQSVITLVDGSGLRLTTAYYYTPSGRLIHKRDFRRKQPTEDSAEPPSSEEESVKSNDKSVAKKSQASSTSASETKETWGIDPDIEVAVTPEIAAKVHSSFDLVYFPDNSPSRPIRDFLKKDKEKKKKDQNEKEEAKPEEPLRDEVLDKAIAVLKSKISQKSSKP